MREVTYGKLKTRVAGGTDGQGGGDGPVVVLMHGFGAPGDDLVGLANALPGAPQHTRYVFPEAPMSLGGPYGDGRAWWMIDLAVLQRRAMGERVERSNELPDGLVKARELVREMLDAMTADLAPSPKGLILGGFSQGSMVTCDVALHDDREFAGLILFSSTLIAQQVWEPRMAKRKGLPILQSHGREDPVLAFEDAMQLRNLWQTAGADLTFVEFAGGHAIPPQVLAAAGQFIHNVVG